MNIDLEGMKPGAINIQLYNGLIRVTNPKTGGHQLYQIRTDRKEHYKVRHVEIGHYMSESYVLFSPAATINERGELNLLSTLEKSKRAPIIRQHLKILDYPTHMIEHHGLIYSSRTTCRRCGKKLTDYDSVLRGIGPDCIEHWHLGEHARRFKHMHDTERFGELRQAVRDDEMMLAYLALGYIEQDEVRHAARHYLNELLAHRQRTALAQSA